MELARNVCQVSKAWRKDIITLKGIFFLVLFGSALTLRTKGSPWTVSSQKADTHISTVISFLNKCSY